MAIVRITLDPSYLHCVDLDTFNNHKHNYDKPIMYKPAAEATIKYSAHDEQSELRETGPPVGGS